MRKELVVLIGGLLMVGVLIVLFKPTDDREAPPDSAPHTTSEPLPFKLPNGFVATLFSDEVPGARVMARDSMATILVSLTSAGKVVALPNRDTDNKADRVVPVLEGLTKPHGIAFIGDTLYVAEEGAIKSYAYNPETFTAEYIETLATLPTGGGHSSRSLMVWPDNTRLLVSIGSSCNVCNEEDPRRASVLSINLATKEVTPFAKGLRNTVFMTMQYVTGDIWGTDMGRDWLGDDTPPDEINILKQGGNYGWPICYGKNIHDTEFDKNTYIRNPCMTPFETPSHIDIPAHSAPLGIVFVPEEGWPEEWWYDALVAYHGSWNRSTPTGYKIVRIPLDAQGNPTGAAVDFITDFTTDNKVIGRPVDLMIEPGGVLWITDDEAGAVYRVARTAE
jgi:glucose/arabinose dehydrogenase